jgi:signal recognition particle subunit SEC65
MSENKLEIKKANLSMVKALMVTQVLIEILDDISEEVQFNLIKKRTKTYSKWLEDEVNLMVKNTFNSNKDLVNKMIENVRNGSNENEKYFKINE